MLKQRILRIINTIGTVHPIMFGLKTLVETTDDEHFLYSIENVLNELIHDSKQKIDEQFMTKLQDKLLRIKIEEKKEKEQLESLDDLLNNI